MTAVSPEMLQLDDAIVHEDRRITSRQLALSISVNKGRGSHIIPDLGNSKVCAEWVARSPAVGQKTERKAISSELLARLKLRERPSYPGLLYQMKSGVMILKRSQNAIHGKALSSFSPKIHLKNSSSAGKVMITVFGDSEGVIIVDITPRRKTVNSDAFIRTPIEIRKRFKRVQSHTNQTGILLLHDNVRPHTVRRPGTPSQNLAGQCYPNHTTAPI